MNALPRLWVTVLFDDGIHGSPRRKTFSIRVNHTVRRTKPIYQRALEGIDEMVGCCPGAFRRRRVSRSERTNIADRYAKVFGSSGHVEE